MSDITKHFINMCFVKPIILLDTILTASDFQEEIESNVFEIMLRVAKTGGEVTTVSIKNEGADINFIIGVDESVIPAKWKYIEGQIVKNSQRLRIRTLCERIAKDKNLDPIEAVNIIQTESADILTRNTFQTVHISVALDEAMAGVQLRRESGGLAGPTSGYKVLDAAFLGWQQRKLYYVGGRPAQGKTALLMNFALHCGVPCGIISSESGRPEIANRLVSIRSGLNLSRITAGKFTAGEYQKYERANDEINKMEIQINDEPNKSIDKVCMTARQMILHHNIKVLFIDYIQILNPSSGKKFASMREATIDKSKTLKELCRNLNIPIVCTAQLGRNSDGERPQLKDFSESAQIEQDADGAILIWNQKKGDTDQTTLLIAKNRDGMTGDINYRFVRENLTFYELGLIGEEHNAK